MERWIAGERGRNDHAQPQVETIDTAADVIDEKHSIEWFV